MGAVDRISRDIDSYVQMIEQGNIGSGAAPDPGIPGTIAGGDLFVTPDMLSDHGAADTHAAIEQAIWEDEKEFTLPHLRDIYESIGDANLTGEQVDRSGTLSNMGRANAKAQTERNLSRYGANLNRMQRKEFEDKFSRGTRIAEIDARNATREAKKQRDMNLLAGSTGAASQGVRESNSV